MRHAQHAAGYVAAAAMSAYLVVKAVWVVHAAGFGDAPGQWRTDAWIALNLVTIAMAVVGALLGLALARDWHRVFPGRLLLVVAWLAGGFLVSLLPYLLLDLVLDVVGVGGSTGATLSTDPATFPEWEQVLLTFGFLGTAAGVGVGLPIYAWHRWFAGSTPHDAGRVLRGYVGRPARLDASSTTGALLAVVLGAWWLLWAVHGEAGSRLDAAASDRALQGTLALWALGAGLVALVRPGRARLAALATVFVGAGSLFAWNAWRLPFTLGHPPGFQPVAPTQLAVAHHVAGIVAGLLLLRWMVVSARATRAAGS